MCGLVVHFRVQISSHVIQTIHAFNDVQDVFATTCNTNTLILCDKCLQHILKIPSNVSPILDCRLEWRQKHLHSIAKREWADISYHLLFIKTVIISSSSCGRMVHFQYKCHHMS